LLLVNSVGIGLQRTKEAWIGMFIEHTSTLFSVLSQDLKNVASGYLWTE
jgi:hypothetical protein